MSLFLLQYDFSIYFKIQDQFSLKCEGCDFWILVSIHSELGGFFRIQEHYRNSLLEQVNFPHSCYTYVSNVVNTEASQKNID